MIKIALTLIAVWMTADGKEREVIMTDPQASLKSYDTAAACRADLLESKIWASVAKQLQDHARDSRPDGSATLLRLTASASCTKKPLS